MRVPFMDPLTDLFTAVRVSSAVQLRPEAIAPWSLTSEPHSREPFAYAHFAHVAQGNSRLTTSASTDPIPLAGGDYILVSPSTSYMLRDDPQFTEPTTLVYGWFVLDAASGRSVDDLLPPLILIRRDQDQGRALRETLATLGSEVASTGPGSAIVVNRLADVLFIQTLPAFVGTGQCTEAPPWLHALADQQIGTSLRAFHGAIDRPWTLATLAATAGMSRSAFAAKFKALLGETPLEYLTRWRMQTA